MDGSMLLEPGYRSNVEGVGSRKGRVLSVLEERFVSFQTLL